MVASQETLDALGDVGLNMYERKIYAALLSRGVSTAGELSEMTGVPRSRAYDVLESLADKGFSILKPSKPMEYVAVPPEEAMENAKDLHREEMKDNIKRIEKFKDSEAVDELKNLYDEGVDLVDPASMSGALKGRYTVYQHLGNMIKDSESEIKIMTTAKGLKDLYENHYDVLEEASDKGVQIKILTHHDQQANEAYDNLKKVAAIRKISQNLNNLPKGRFSIVDNEKLTLSLTHDEVHPTQDTAFWANSTHAASDTLAPMFDVLWQSCKE